MPEVFYLYCLDFPNGKRYVGLTRSPSARSARHRHLASFGFHTRVHAAIRKYGSPPLKVLCVGSFDYISDLEIKFIACCRTTDRDFGYNVAFGGAINPTASSEVRAKLSAAALGRRPSAETRTKQSVAHKGIPLSDHHRASIGAAHKGKTRPPEWRANISNGLRGKPFKARGYSGMTGKSHSPETKAKISAAQKGRVQPPVSAQTRAKMSAAHKGVPLSAQHVTNILKAKIRSAKRRGDIAAALAILEKQTFAEQS